jgi:putative transposase
LGESPYLRLDAKVEKVRDSGRVVRKCLVLAYGVHESGYREVIGLDVGECETEAFWRSFLRGLVERGLGGVQLVVSDAHAGLKKAIAQVLGCVWQRCSVHFLREALGHARREQQPMLAALLRPLEFAEDRADVRFDRFWCHVELLRDSAVGASLGDQGEHFELAWGQVGEVGERSLIAERSSRGLGCGS